MSLAQAGQDRLAIHGSSRLAVDVPMSRVKFNVNTEYAYLQNFKILQSQSWALLRPCILLTSGDRLLQQAPG